MEKTSLFAFTRACRADQLPTRGQRAAFTLWNLAALLLSSAAICAVSLLLAVGSYGMEIFYSYFHHPLSLLLNYLPVLLMQTLLYCIFGRQWLSFLLTALVVVTASVGNLYKLRFRYEPFVFSDLSAISAALGVAGNYDLRPNARILFALAVVFCTLLFLFFLCRGRWRGRTRLLAAALILFSIWPLWNCVYSNTAIYEEKTKNEDFLTNTNEAHAFVTKGFVYPFLYSIKEDPSIPPDGYDAARAAALLSAYEDAQIPQEQRVNLLVFQLESFRDIRQWGAIQGIRDEAYAVWDALKEESVHGVLAVNNYAGGTANTERGVLASARTMLSPKAPYPSCVWYLRQQGYHTLGNHNYFCYYYNRLNINRNLGFEDYRYYEDHYQEVYGEPTPFENSDELFFNEVLDEYRTLAEQGEDIFSFNVTLQGHYPYRTDSAFYSGFLEEGNYSSEIHYALDNYLGTVHNTQECIRRLTEALRKDETPVVLLLYGDHCPNIGDSSYVSDELGVDLDVSTYQGFLNMFSTEYIIWANDAAKEKLGRDFTGEGPAVSACYLMNVLFDELNWQGSAFQQFSRNTQAVLPIVNSNGCYVENGQYTLTLDEEGEQALSDFDCVTFYWKSNFEPPA